MHRPVVSRKRPLIVVKIKTVKMTISSRDDVQAEALFVLFKVASAPDGVDLLQQLPHIVQAMLHLTLTIASETTVDDLRINSLGKDVYISTLSLPPLARRKEPATSKGRCVFWGSRAL
jgi:hypothetical protein